MQRTGAAQYHCPECGHKLQAHEYKLSVFDGFALGCLGEIAIWTVVILLGALISTLAFDTAYPAAILIVVLGALVASFMYRRYVCPSCERVFGKRYLRELKLLKEPQDYEDRAK